MRDLIILGTGVHAAEMAHIVDRINAHEPAWNLLGHVAPRSDYEGDMFNGRSILGAVDTLVEYPDAALVPDNEFPKDIDLPSEQLISLIDPSAFIHPSAEIGRGCVIYPNCFVGFNVKIGDRVFVLANSVINHDDVIGDRVVFASGVTVAGIVTVEDDSYLGQGCTVRQDLTIGNKSIVGMGAVVVDNVEANTVVVGNPARFLRSSE